MIWLENRNRNVRIRHHQVILDVQLEPSVMALSSFPPWRLANMAWPTQTILCKQHLRQSCGPIDHDHHQNILAEQISSLDTWFKNIKLISKCDQVLGSDQEDRQWLSSCEAEKVCNRFTHSGERILVC